MTKFWTYAYIDYDLLSDDLNSAQYIMPVYIWQTVEEALAAAEDDYQERFDNEDEVVKLDWKRSMNDTIIALPEDSTQIIVYPVILKEKS